MTGLIVLVVLVGLAVFFIRRRHRSGESIERTFNVEPPAGRLGKRKGERL
jgi:hypothetical protein